MIKYTIQISTHNTAQSFKASLAKWLSVCLFLIVGSSPAAVTSTFNIYWFYCFSKGSVKLFDFSFCQYHVALWWLIPYCSLLHLMCVIACAHASTRVTSLMCVKNSTHHFYLWHLLSGTLEWKKWNKGQKHQIE